MSRRDTVLTVGLALVLAALYLSISVGGALLVTAATVLLVGEAVLAIVDEVFPRMGKGDDPTEPPSPRRT